MGKESLGQDDSDKLADEVIGAISRRIIELRKKRGLSQTELGKLVGVTQGRIFELEQRSSNVTIKTLVRMAQVFEVELVELVADVHELSAQRLADALDRWTKALEERTAYEKTLMQEIAPLVDDMKALAVRRPEPEKNGADGSVRSSGPGGARRVPRKTGHA